MTPLARTLGPNQAGLIQYCGLILCAIAEPSYSAGVPIIQGLPPGTRAFIVESQDVTFDRLVPCRAIFQVFGLVRQSSGQMMAVDQFRSNT